MFIYVLCINLGKYKIIWSFVATSNNFGVICPSISFCVDFCHHFPVGAPSLLFHFQLQLIFNLLLPSLAFPETYGSFILSWCLF